MTELLDHQQTQRDIDSEFADIVGRFGDVASAESLEDAKAFHQLEEAIESPEASPLTPTELKYRRDELLTDFMERPYEAFVAEVMTYTLLSERRSVAHTDQTGALITEFATVNADQKQTDLHFRIIEHTSGDSEFKVEVPVGDSRQPCFISADSQGNIRVEQEYGGNHGRMDLEFGGNGSAEARLLRFFRLTGDAIRKATDRPKEEQNSANEHAKHLLIQKMVNISAV